ncbi:hypothetical protein BWI17_03715 [Betaproteobacteria bacterium GR16-43]|nr:hypothetical protein BWI17_03715 [Betaproteobacteria bacterium GR16-43]
MVAAEIYWIPEAVGGRLGVMARPRSDDWLSDEVASWRAAGVGLVVSLLEPSEVRELRLSEEEPLCRDNGIDFVSFPVADRGVPSSVRAAEKLVMRIESDLRSGAAIAIHCRAGIGRSALLAACILKYQGLPEREIFSSISRARGVACPDTEAQIRWVKDFPIRRADV